MKTASTSIRLLPVQRHRQLNGGALLAALLLVVAVAKAEAGYTFKLIADTTGPFSDFGAVPSPSLNALGTVAFNASLDTGGRGVFTGNGGIVTTIATTSLYNGVFGLPSINSAGTVAFFALNWNGLGERIVAGNGGILTTIADTAGQFLQFSGGYTTSINTTGTVAFSASLKSGGGGVFVGAGATATPIILNSSSFSPSADFSLNETSTLAFRGYFGPNFANTGIFTSSNGTIIPITDSSGPLNYFGTTPSISSAGRVAFVAGINGQGGGTYGIYSGNGGPLTTIADLAGPFSYLGDFYSYQPSINASGMVAFSAALDAGGGGLFIGDGTVTNKVIGAGDPLFGSIVTGAGGSPHSLNDAGQVAFYYTLANGTTGIAVATPVPEPSASLLLAALPVILGARRRSRRAEK